MRQAEQRRESTVKRPMETKNARKRIQPSPYAKAVWRLYSVVLIPPCMLVLLLIGAYSPLTAVIISVVLLIAYGLLLFFEIPLYCRCCVCEFTREFIRLTTGFFLRRTIHIRYDTIQYCVLSQSVVQRLFHVCSVKLMMAGSVSVIRQVSLADGQQIRTMVESKIFHETPPKRGDTHA